MKRIRLAPLVSLDNFEMTQLSNAGMNGLSIEKFFELGVDLHCIADLNGHFVKVSKAWVQFLGKNLEELEGNTFLDFVHPDDLPATYAEMGKSVDR